MTRATPRATAILPAHTEHPRSYQANRYVYPVLSRRSRGISLGINLNPDKVCNFDCIYCQVDRRSAAETRFVDLPKVLEELDATLRLVTSGAVYGEPPFDAVPGHLRRLNDIAFSGDGEPTTYTNFDAIVAQVADLKRRHELDAVKLVLITNASRFHRPAVRRGLEILDASNGEIWAKLDAGTEAYFQLVDRTSVKFGLVLDNLRDAARVRPLVIQSLFMKVQGEGPSDAEISAYIDRLGEILAAGGRIDRVQVYTVARRPAESFVGALAPAEVDAIAQRVHTSLGLPVESYYGSDAGG